MSSFIAVLNGNAELINKIVALTQLKNTVHSTEHFTLLADPLCDRLFYAQNTAKNTGWICSGIGIHSHPDLTVMTTSEWDNLLATDLQKTGLLNGHFAGACFSANSIRFFTDPVGLRSLFYARVNDAILVSTRFDWLMPFSSKTINWNEFGSHWLAINSFCGNSFVHGISRIRGRATYNQKNQQFEVIQKQWLPSNKHINVEDFLVDFASSVYAKKQNISVGLSGGLDSRLLFALLVDSDLIPSISTYTFGGIKHPDELVVEQLLRTSGIEHQWLIYNKADFSLDKLAVISGRTLLNSSIPNVLANSLYARLGQQGVASIDGGIGEIGRRRFLKKIELGAHKAVTDQNVDKLLPYFYAPKGDFFNADLSQKMHQGMKNDFSEYIATMPTATSLGVGNWLDLFTIRTRLNNIPGFNQELVDDLNFHLMPFAQSDFLSCIFSLSISERKNAKLFRSLIKKHHPIASKISLVKGAEQYPYWMKDTSAAIWNKIQSKMGRGYSDTLVQGILQNNETEIRDLFATKSIKDCGIYNLKKVDDIVSSFYDLNDYTFAGQLNWLLTFELFRKSLSDA